MDIKELLNDDLPFTFESCEEDKEKLTDNFAYYDFVVKFGSYTFKLHGVGGELSKNIFSIKLSEDRAAENAREFFVILKRLVWTANKYSLDLKGTLSTLNEKEESNTD